jgi:mannose-6-phosphate isomerase-like protein (cupin superfamily)
MWSLFWIIVVVIIIALIVRQYGANIFSSSSVMRIAGGDFNTPKVNNPAAIWSANIERETMENKDWRKVLTTSEGLQVVAMKTPVGESLGWEVHNDNDQFFRVESGRAVVSTMPSCTDTKTRADVNTVVLTDGMSTLIPRGMCHNVMNEGPGDLHMYTIYGPKHHPPGTIDHTHEDEKKRESMTKSA